MTLTGPSGAGAMPTISPWSGPAPVISPRPPAAAGLSPWPAGPAAVPSWSALAATSDSLPVVVRPLAGPVTAQRPVRSRGIGPLENPVLPGGEPAENLRLAGLRAGKAEIGLHAGQRVRREAGPFLDHEPYLVGPVEVVRGLGDQAEPLGVGGGQVLPGGGRRGLGVGLAAEEPDLQPALAAAGWHQPRVEVIQPEDGRRCGVLVIFEDAVQHVLAVSGEGYLQQQPGEAAAWRDERDQAPRRGVQPSQRPLPVLDDLVDQPVVRMGQQQRAGRRDRG